MDSCYTAYPPLRVGTSSERILSQSSTANPNERFGDLAANCISSTRPESSLDRRREDSTEISGERQRDARGMVSSDAEPASLRAQFGNHPRARRDALLRAYVERRKQEAIEEKT